MPVLFKLRELDEAAAHARELQSQGQRVVFTNGCFDLLHPGHIVHLQQAHDLGDALFVAINSDESVRQLKGPHRPVYDAHQRALVLSALACVETVIVFDDLDALRVIETLRPDIYIKGGDYTLDTINQQERRLLERLGTEIHLLPKVNNFSTTHVIHLVQERT